jgi:two-component system alkaline phosphatase synthesis response regulator PhoP
MQYRASTAGGLESNTGRFPLLIVDDDRDTCDLMCAFLSQNYECDMAYDGEQAFNKISQNRYAAIIADLMLPKLDGYGVMNLAAQILPNTPVIVVTAMSTDHDRAMEMGAFDCIIKPFELEQIETSIKRAVNSYAKVTPEMEGRHQT